ncbi:MAG TPA: TOMM precursor leader peptide-binding protein, partial [Pirellulales bacterium]|nr:TOMM precursor leader peptide-binding protein [Pirellulales bacterium]
MLNRPRFKPHLHVTAVPDEGVFVLSGTTQALLRGRLYELVAPHIDGCAADEICDRLAQQASAAQVYYTLAQLEKRGYLAEAADTPFDDEAAWWSSQDVDPATAALRLAQGRVAIVGFGGDAEPLGELLAEWNVTIDQGADFSVVAVDHYLRSPLADLNDAALASGKPWLLVKPWGSQFWLGPLFRPGTTGCWQCLADRLRSNRPVENYVRSRSSLAEPSLVDRAGTAATRQAAWGLTANAVATWLVRGELS